MKKGFYLILVLGFMVSTGFAQIGISKGLIGGINLATAGGADVATDVKSTTGYAAGVFLELNIPGPFSVEPEALYSIKGSKTEILGVTTTVTATYIDVPVLVKFYFSSPVIKPFLFAGPSYSILLSAKRKIEVPRITPLENDIKDTRRANDLGAVFGAGVNFSLPAIDVRIDARYNYGLSTLDKDGNVQEYNRVASLYVSLSF
jgi:outer membrane immunogenic protein